MRSVMSLMNRCLALALTAVTLSPGGVRAENWLPLEVTISGIEPGRGGKMQLFVFLKDGFPISHKKALEFLVVPVVGKKVTVTLNVPADVPFALKAHHDEDGNSKVSKNWTGIFPAEGLGFSSGAMMSPMPPSFSMAKMIMPQGNATSITLRYP